MVAQGSIVDVQLTSDTGTSTADAVIQQASGIIASNGNNTVVKAQVLTSLLAGLGNFITSLNYDQPFQADVKILCNTDRNQAQDVADDVASAFYQVTGKYPTTVSAVLVTPPNSQGTSPSLDSSGVAGNDTGASAAVKSVSNQISDWVTSLGNLGTNLLIGLAAIIVLAIVLIAYGPNIGKIASSV